MKLLPGGLALVLAMSVLPALATSAASGSPVSGGAAASAVKAGQPAQKAARRDNRWTPPQGITFNNPMVASQRRAITARILRAVRNTAKGERIRISTWNFDDSPAATELIEAKKRGVSVQVLVSANTQNPNWTRLNNALDQGSRKNPARRSFAKVCHASCRAKGGIAHTKMFLFSRVHGAKHVTMLGSTNLTTPAGNRQWNDLLTLKGKKVLYQQYLNIFQEMQRDKNVGQPWRVYNANSGKFRSFFYPGDHLKYVPVLRELSKVRCQGATGSAGNSGNRTIVRIAIAGWFDEYGARIARRVRELWNRGCDVRIITVLTGRGVNRALRAPGGRGPVPMRQITIDYNSDGVPDRYMHLKFFTVNGVYGKRTNAKLFWTGSGNWSARASRSDEVMMRVDRRPGWTTRYQNHANRLFDSPYAHGRQSSSRTQGGAPVFDRALLREREAAGTLPEWFENDW